mgnify:FL=1
MDTEKCAALLCALEEGTLARAADRLGYTPSGISRMIAALEEDVGFPLLYRGRSGVSATGECEALLPALRQMVYQAESCRQTAASLRGLEQGSITVGANYRFYARQLAQLMARFREKHPGIAFQTIEGTSTTLVTALQEHRADLCIISRREGPHQWLPLRQDQMMVMLSPQHPLAADAVPIRRLETESYIEIYPGRETDNSRILAENGVCPGNRFAGVEDDFSAMAMVEAGLGVALVNALIAGTLNGNVVFRPLDPPQYVEVGIATPPPEIMSPAARRFLNFVRENMEG